MFGCRVLRIFVRLKLIQLVLLTTSFIAVLLAWALTFPFNSDVCCLNPVLSSGSGVAMCSFGLIHTSGLIWTSGSFFTFASCFSDNSWGGISSGKQGFTLHSGVKVCKGCVEPSHKLFLSSILLYLGLWAMSIPHGPCRFEASKFTLGSMIGQYRPATCSWKWSQCYLWLGKLQWWIDKVLLGPEHPLGNTRVSLPMVDVRTGIFIQDLYHQLDLPSDMLIFWPVSLSMQCMAIQHTVGNTHSLLVVLI